MIPSNTGSSRKTSFKRITLTFVYFRQVIFFWAVILHITKSNIGNISQTLSKSSQQEFCQNSWAENLFWSFLFSREVSTAFSYFVGVSSNSILQVRTKMKKKITNGAKIVNVFWLLTIVTKTLYHRCSTGF